MKNKHTPSPWQFAKNEPLNDGSYPMTYHVRTVEDGGGYVAEIALDGNGRDEANARLIAAAPELLDLVYTYWQSRSEDKWEREEPEIHAQIKALIERINP